MDRDDDAVRKLLTKHAPVILDKLDLNERFLSCLERDHCLNRSNKSEITALKFNDMERIGKLMEHIRRDPVRRFNAFVQALTETYQFGVLDELEVAYTIPMDQGGGAAEAAEVPVGLRDLANKLKDGFKAHLFELRKLDLDGIKLLLIQYDILEDYQVEAVMSHRTSVDKIEELFTKKMPGRPDMAYLKLGKAIVKTGQGHMLAQLGVTEEERAYLKDHV